MNNYNFYYCTIEQTDKDFFQVAFPDMPSVNTFGETKEKALEYATEALNGTLERDVARGFLPPSPSFKDENCYPIEVEPLIIIAIQLRLLRGKESQTEVAKRLDIAYQSYQILENPTKSNPTIKTLDKVAKALGKKLEIAIK